MKILIILKNFNQRRGLPGGVGNANEEIAKEMRIKNLLFAKKEGIMKENLMELEGDWDKKLSLEEGKD